MELVSIVVPVYQVEPYLEKCIRSIQNQTYSNLEIILVDDGSPDCCGEICDRFARQDPRIQAVHKENGGLSDARNYGVGYTSGKYLLFVDSDDTISETLVEKAVAAAEQCSSDLVLFDYYYTEKESREWRTCESIPADRVLRLSEQKNLLETPPAVWCKLFNREFYLQTGITFPKGRYFEDLGTTPKFLLAAQRIVYLKEPLYNYMIRSDSIMGNQRRDKKYLDVTAVLDQVLDYYRQQGAYERYRPELEFLVFKNAYFEPMKELVLARQEEIYAELYRSYIRTHFPNIDQNQYVRRMRGKDRLHLWILNNRKYPMMRGLSKCRQISERIRKR